jgi:hypothetical protein
VVFLLTELEGVDHPDLRCQSTGLLTVEEYSNKWLFDGHVKSWPTSETEIGEGSMLKLL